MPILKPHRNGARRPALPQPPPVEWIDRRPSRWGPWVIRLLIVVSPLLAFLLLVYGLGILADLLSALF